jgi:cytochrome c oxidase subunit 2
VIAREMWFQFGVATFTFVLVVGLLVFVLVRRSRHDASPEAQADERRPQRWVILGGIVFPLVTLSVLFGWSVHDLVALRGPATYVDTVDVIGHRWWWEIKYPDRGIVEANHLVLPEGYAVRLRLRSADVIHSVSVPQLGPKLDALPGDWNTTWLRATHTGRYRGVCAEFCGLQHAHMDFLVDVLPLADYNAWIAAAQKPAHKPTTPSEQRGLAFFTTHTCAYCHTIVGTGAHGSVGPGLTHLASRPGLAAATLPNTRADLARWIADPRKIKPGVLMPPSHLSDADMTALLDYLTSLK